MDQRFIKKVEYALYRLKVFYKGGEKNGKLLARQLRGKNANTIPVIKHGECLHPKIVFQQYSEKLCTSITHTKSVQNKMEDFLSNVEVPSLQPDQLAVMESSISISKIKSYFIKEKWIITGC